MPTEPKPTVTTVVQHHATVVIGGLLTVAPQLIRVIPPDYRDVATGVLGALVALWHLYTPRPPLAKS